MEAAQPIDDQLNNLIARTRSTVWSPHLIDCSIARRLLSLALLQFHTVGELEQRLDHSLFTQCIPSKSIHFMTSLLSPVLPHIAPLRPIKGSQ